MSCKVITQYIHSAIHYNSIPTQSNDSFSITIQLHYNYIYDVMLMSLIVIHLLKFNKWNYEIFWT
jgi:hypothetical protein